jgi:hypothetical protein
MQDVPRVDRKQRHGAAEQYREEIEEMAPSKIRR